MSDSPHGLLPSRLEKLFVKIVQPISRVLVEAQVSPNLITLSSLGFAALAGYWLMEGKFFLALVGLVLMGLSDVVDGEVARLSRSSSPWGGVLDSVVDRYTEAVLLVGLSIYFWDREAPFWVLVVGLLLIGGFLVSYVKARAEAAQIPCQGGLVQRSERLVLLAIGMAGGEIVLKGALVTATILSHVTAVERLIKVRASARRSQLELQQR